jgi:hypothetical protein
LDIVYKASICVFACYILIGIAVAAIGPVKRLLDEAIADLREAPAADDDSDTRTVSPRKVLLFRAVMSLAIILIWGRFLVLAMTRPPAHAIVPTETDYMAKPRVGG